jgi:2-desacetyl-2-hydroxyethyl bacteriochlorophyllide A dehydrogenase
MNIQPSPAEVLHAISPRRNDRFRLVFTGKQEVDLVAVELSEPASNEVLVRTSLSLMSTGTEMIAFNRNFEIGTHWEKYVRYPFYPGYSTIGIVEQIGRDVQTLKIGDRVACRIRHASHGLVAEDKCFPIPQTISDESAVWFALAKIAFMGARVARYSLGDSVLIIGAGPIGQMSVRWAFAAGVERIIVVDSIAQRLELAKKGGASLTLTESLEKVKAMLNNELPGIVMDTTGNAKVFTPALSLVPRLGRLVILGDTGTPSQQCLTQDVIKQGITIVGAHDGHDDLQWNNRTITQLFFELVQSKRFSLTGLTSHLFPISDFLKAYETANTKRGETMGILFKWS